MGSIFPLARPSAMTQLGTPVIFHLCNSFIFPLSEVDQLIMRWRRWWLIDFNFVTFDGSYHFASRATMIMIVAVLPPARLPQPEVASTTAIIYKQKSTLETRTMQYVLSATRGDS